MERIICFVCCLLCAFPLFVIGHFNKESREPIGFWSGDRFLRDRVKDIKGYNFEMSKLYVKCSLAFVITGVICLVSVKVGMICILLECTIGIYIVWKLYKRILSKYV